jgi:hypothetical protein
VLVVMSRGAYDLKDAFVELGLVLWIVGAGLAELVVWPTERVLQRLVSATWERSQSEARKIATRAAVSAWSTCVVILAAIVVMFQKP